MRLILSPVVGSRQMLHYGKCDDDGTWHADQLSTCIIIYSQPARSPPGTSTHSHHGSRLWLAIEQVLMLRPETSKGRSRGERRLAVMLSDYCKDDGPAAPIDVSRSRHYKYSAQSDSAHGYTRMRRRTGGPDLWAAMLEKGSTPQAPSSCVRSMSLILCLT